MEEFAVFCKKKGFIYPSSEIYGGLAGIYDYGHLGTQLKYNWINEWRKFFLRLDDNFVEIDASIVMPEKVFEASGHIENFYDPLAECSKCGNAERADKLIEDKLDMRVEGLGTDELFKILKENNLKCPNCSSEFSGVTNFNLMFPVTMGPKNGIKAYLRGETAQSPYVNFKVQYELQRKKLPLGLAVVGKAYRNEIAPKNMIIRGREFEQAELQIFFNPSKINEHSDFDSVKDYKLKVMLKNERDNGPKFMKVSELLKYGLPKFYVYHMAKVQQFYFDVMKIDPELFRFLELTDDEKAFYNKYHFDIEVKFNNPDSWVEVGGVHYRTNHDLGGHQKMSKVNMEVIDEETREKFVPHVLELSFGVGRNVYSLLDSGYNDDKERGNLVLKLNPKLAPYKVAILPLVNKGDLPNVARGIYESLLEEDIGVFYDRSGSVGRRYARQDEIGTPYCVTVDFEAVEDGENKGTVTIRDRDTMRQARIKIEEVPEIISKLIKGKIEFKDL